MSKFYKQSNNYINFDSPFQSTATFKYTKLSLPKRNKYLKKEQYQGSADHGEIDLKSDVNQPTSGKLWQSTTVPSQCEQLSYP